MFQLKVRSYGICPSLPGLFRSEWILRTRFSDAVSNTLVPIAQSVLKSVQCCHYHTPVGARFRSTLWEAAVIGKQYILPLTTHTVHVILHWLQTDWHVSDRQQTTHMWSVQCDECRHACTLHMYQCHPKVSHMLLKSLPLLPTQPPEFAGNYSFSLFLNK